MIVITCFSLAGRDCVHDCAWQVATGNGSPKISDSIVTIRNLQSTPTCQAPGVPLMASEVQIRKFRRVFAGELFGGRIMES